MRYCLGGSHRTNYRVVSQMCYLCWAWPNLISKLILLFNLWSTDTSCCQEFCVKVDFHCRYLYARKLTGNTMYMEGRALMKKLNLLNFHFYARLSYIVSLFYLRASERNIIYATVEISTLYQVIRLRPFLGHTLEHVKQLKVFKVGNFSVYLDLLLLIFRNWLLLSFNFLFFNLLSSWCN